MEDVIDLTANDAAMAAKDDEASAKEDMLKKKFIAQSYISEGNEK